jgi:hypothetical protein
MLSVHAPLMGEVGIDEMEEIKAWVFETVLRLRSG